MASACGMVNVRGMGGVLRRRDQLLLETGEIAKIAKPTVEISDKVRVNLEKFVWSSREK